MTLPHAMLLQQPSDRSQADLVLLGKLPAWRTSYECRDESLCISLAESVADPTLPDAGSDCPNTNCYTVCIDHRFG
jgi:hypothetical protein